MNMNESMLTMTPEWSDDQTMSVLFAPFRDSREVNPSSWDRKLRFWSRAIVQKHSLEGKAYFKARDLPRHFERKGKVPFCLGVVVQDMLKLGKLQRIQDFQPCLNQSWGYWSYNIFMKKPVVFTFDWLLKKPVTWTFKQIVGSGSNSVSVDQSRADSTTGLDDTEYVIPDVVQSLAERLLTVHHSSVRNPLTDTVHVLEDFQEECSAVCADDRTFHLVIASLCHQKKCAIQDVDGTKVVVFAAGPGTVKRLSDTELQVFRLKAAENKLHREIDHIGEEMEKARLEAKSYLQRGKKMSAKNCLAKKKRLEAQQAKKEHSIDNIHQLLINIQQAHTDKQVLDAYSMGVAAMKDFSKDLSLDRVDSVMDDIREVLDDQDEINRSMVLGDAGDDAELLAELEDLSDLPQVAPGAAGRLGDTAAHHQTEPPVPHQQLIDSMCRMKVADELPDVPTHDPISPVIGFSPPRPTTTSERVPLVSQGHSPATGTEDLQPLYNLPDVPTDSPVRPSSFHRSSASPQQVAMAASGGWESRARKYPVESPTSEYPVESLGRKYPGESPPGKLISPARTQVQSQHWPSNRDSPRQGFPTQNTSWNSPGISQEQSSGVVSPGRGFDPRNFSSPNTYDNYDDTQQAWGSVGSELQVGRQESISRPWQPWRSPDSDPDPAHSPPRGPGQGGYTHSPPGNVGHHKRQQEQSPRKSDISWMLQ